MKATQDLEDDDYFSEEFSEEEEEDFWGTLHIINNKNRIVVEGDKKNIDLDEFVIGRGPSCDLVVNCGIVSGKHCSIIKDGDHAYLKDTSTNGTFVQGKRIKKNSRILLKNGTECIIAKTNKKQKVEKLSFIFSRKSAKEDKHGPSSKYFVLQELGRGAFATVHEAEHKETGEKFAIKMIEKKRMSKTPNGEKALVAEVEILKSMDHKNIIGIKEIFDTPEKLYIVLELVRGGELFDLTREKGFFTEDEARPLYVQMLEAVAYLHGQGIAHRDLKLENVLLGEDKKIVKISDFGLSKIVGEGSFMQTICGTPEYLAPEVLTKAKTLGYSKAVDIWSLGVILYTMLSGYRPFDATEDTPIFDKIIKGDFSFPNDEWDDISDEAKDFIKKMLIVDPSLRLTADECLNHPWCTLNQENNNNNNNNNNDNNNNNYDDDTLVEEPSSKKKKIKIKTKKTSKKRPRDNSGESDLPASKKKKIK